MRRLEVIPNPQLSNMPRKDENGLMISLDGTSPRVMMNHQGQISYLKFINSKSS